MSNIQPQVKSFVIADMVIQEKMTNKWSAIGIFDRIYAAKYPCIHSKLGLYIRLGDAEGDYKIRVEFCDESERKLALFQGIGLKIPSRLATPDFGIQTNNLPIPKPGRYYFNLYFNDKLAESVPLDAVEVGKK